MLLSEAIRKGIALSSPLKGEFIWTDGETIYACVLGCALLGSMEASSFENHSQNFIESLLYDEFPLLREEGAEDDLMNQLIYLNDVEEMSREQMLLYVERVEKALMFVQSHESKLIDSGDRPK